jgi:hypothetical protein
MSLHWFSYFVGISALRGVLITLPDGANATNHGDDIPPPKLLQGAGVRHFGEQQIRRICFISFWLPYNGVPSFVIVWHDS